MEEVHDLAEQFLGLVLAGHIGKADAGGGGDVHLGPGAAAHAEHHAVPAHGLFHPAVEEIADQQEGQQGEHPPHQDGGEQAGLGIDLLELGPAFKQAVRPAGVVCDGGAVDIFCGLVSEGDLIPLDLHLPHIFVVGHGHELVVGHVLHRLLQHGREEGHVQEHQDQQRC